MWEMGAWRLPYSEPREWTERDIELPWAGAILDGLGGRVLEVGNATQRLYPQPERDIVCKYDCVAGLLPVHRVDILDWQGSYDTILSISTLEHPGRDVEEEPDEEKAVRCLEHCISLLAPGGELYFTFACGYHPRLQEYVLGREWTELHIMGRTEQRGDWTQGADPDCEFPYEWNSGLAVIFAVLRF